MIKTIKVFILTMLVAFIAFYSRIIEIYKPVATKNIEWKELYDLKSLDPEYIAQGIEVYKDYIFFTVHKQDKDSRLIVFKINNNKLSHYFTSIFPKEATHVSDLSIYNNFLYAIDYSSNNLYKINMEETIKNREMAINKIYPTKLKRSGSIIVTNYNNQDIIFISQFMISKNMLVYKLNDIGKENKKPIFDIKSKYFIQGLYEYNNLIFISSNKYKNDPIFIITKDILIKNNKLDRLNSIALNGPGNMIEDISIWNDYLITSDEETNKIYISKNKIDKIIEGNKK